MLGGAKLAFSYEKICYDLAGLVLLLFFPICILFWERLLLRPLILIPAVLISDGLLSLAVFQLAYRGFWRFAHSKFKSRLRCNSADQTPEPSINSYSELIACWRVRNHVPPE
jgi:hypothetical protein